MQRKDCFLPQGGKDSNKVGEATKVEPKQTPDKLRRLCPIKLNQNCEYFEAYFEAYFAGVFVIKGNMNVTSSFNATLNLTAWSPNTSFDYDKRSSLTILAQAVSLAVIMFSSIFGNTLILLAIYMDRHLREITSVFIANLACADLLLAVMGMPFTLTSSITYDWILGPTLCRLHGMANGIFCFASMLSLASVSIERFVAITKPLKYPLIMTQNTVTLMIVYIWFQSIFCALLPIFGWSRYKYIRNESLCTGDWPNSVSYVLLLFAINFFFPVLIMSYCYYHIFKTANGHRKRIETSVINIGVLTEIELQVRQPNPLDKDLQNNGPVDNGPVDTAQEKSTERQQGRSIGRDKNRTTETKLQKAEKKYKQENKAAKTLLLVMGTFLFCWTPHIIGMACLLFPSCSWPDEFFATTTWLAMMNGACNPLIYGFLNRRFRRSFKKIIFCTIVNRVEHMIS